jgi:phage baseplate assembly protein W
VTNSIKQRSDHLLTDLALSLSHKSLRPVYQVGETSRRHPSGKGFIKDFTPVSARDNLRQAIIARLLTPLGDLEHLGHADYGARVHELIGAGNTETNRNRLKLFILASLKFEPRIESVQQCEVTPSPGTRATVDVQLVVKPVDFTQVVEIGPFRVELG